MLIVLLAGIFISFFVVRHKDFDLRGKAGEDTGAYSLVMTVTRDSAASFSIKHATALKGGYIPAVDADGVPQDPQFKKLIAPDVTADYELVEMSGQQEIRAKRIQFLEYLLGVPPRPGETTGDPPYKMATPEAVVHVAYNPGSTFLIRDKGHRPDLAAAVRSRW
ncbi:hypothetical protein A2Z33_01715 [Candidatus Gottesmanbacteria bacterium RBG_16_52_11]|uniref:Uncharacterized protein n=1 Tax=Candidatus Gottesmanbacteria bacterium RBG_16_52_11 TaxID=1798374 RepID=A0A1F5YP79_9BACT|nr:MAG: hypothetical protein A2Z33_01715 [Candidatus Gottesmanbacteria bacterium RBG_16_52_11]